MVPLARKPISASPGACDRLNATGAPSSCGLPRAERAERDAAPLRPGGALEQQTRSAMCAASHSSATAAIGERALRAARSAVGQPRRAPLDRAQRRCGGREIDAPELEPAWRAERSRGCARALKGVRRGAACRRAGARSVSSALPSRMLRQASSSAIAARTRSRVPRPAGRTARAAPAAGRRRLPAWRRRARPLDAAARFGGRLPRARGCGRLGADAASPDRCPARAGSSARP